MAVIGKIREKSLLVLIVIGGAMLAFILTDLLSSGGSIFDDGRNNIGVIDGHEIPSISFDNKLQKEIENYKKRENTADVPDVLASQIRDQVWNTLIRDFVLGKELEELGVTVSKAELADMIYGQNPHPSVKQAFTNPETGVFNSSDVIRFMKNLDQDETGQTKSQWLTFEASIKEQREVTKYNTMIMKGLGVTSEEAKRDYQASEKKMNLKYTLKGYASIADSTVEVSDSDMRTYYQNNSSEFKQQKMRSLRYVQYRIVPSQADSAEAKRWVDETYDKFVKTDNDSVFVSLNSDKEFDFKYYSENLLPTYIDTNLFMQDSIGYIQGPDLKSNGTYSMTKVSDIKYAPDSVSARHIVISFQTAEKEVAQARMDSINEVLNNGGDFAEMAKLFSEDVTTKEDSGKLGWFQEGVMLKVISEFCFNAEAGTRKVLESPVGIHIIEVLEKSPVVRKVKFATVEREIESSKETFDYYFVNSNQLSLAVEEGNDMATYAIERGLLAQPVDIKESDNGIPGVNASRNVVRWAYNAEENAVSEPLSVDGGFVVAQLNEIREDGIADFEKVKEQAKAGAIKDKKAEQMTEELKGTDINTIAGNIGAAVQDANGVTFSAFSIPGIGFEPELLGKIFSLKQGDLSLPIKGRNGVFVIFVESVEEAIEREDHAANKGQIEQGRNARVNYEVFEALKERANIEDKRYLFY